jgi:hypothetical protein
MALYALAFHYVDRVQFLNGDDLLFFVTHRLVSSEKAVLVRSSGVCLQKFDPAAIDRQSLRRLRTEL